MSALISKDMFSTVLNQGWKIIAGPVVLLLIPLLLTPEVQGFWYAFGSLAALSSFADLGFSNIVLQFSAHEFAHLRYSRGTGFGGDRQFQARLASLFRFVFRWVTTVTIVSYPVIFGAGVYLFHSRGNAVEWVTPWLIYCTASGLNFASMTILSFIEGCDQVAGAQRIRFEVAMTNTAVSSIGLVLHLGLFALSIGVAASFIVFVVVVSLRYGRFLTEVLRTPRDTDVSWRKPILRLLWRTAVSYSSGYFIFQLYTPVMFRFHGPVDAGKVGISLSLWGAIFALSSTWITAVTPRVNMLVARRDWAGLDRLVSKNTLRCLLTFFLVAAGVFAVIAVLYGRVPLVHKIASRFMSPIALATLGVGWVFQVIINGLAVYLRAHKQEPFVFTSLTSAAIITVATVLSAMYLPSDWFFLGFLLSYLVVFPWILIMFRNKRRLWHQEYTEGVVSG